MYLEDYITLEEFGKENKKIEDEIRDTQEEIKNFSSPEEKLDKNALKKLISKKIDLIDSNPTKLKKICLLAINKITVKNKKISIEFNF